MNFFTFCRTLAPTDWKKPVNKDWTVKDVVAHMVGWEKEGVKVLKEFRKGGTGNPWFLKTDDDYAGFNKKSVAFYKDYSPEDLLGEWNTWRKETATLLRLIGEGVLHKRPDMQWVFDETEGDHHAHHLNQMKKILGKE